MGQKISDADLVKLSLAAGLDVRAVRSVLAVETSGAGFSAVTGKIIIRFEPKKFFERTARTVADLHTNQSSEWAAYEAAAAVNQPLAMASTSWGIGQIMGFNAAGCGYQSTPAMVDAFMQSEYLQIGGMLTFIRSNLTMYNALKACDWAVFADRYNGAGYRVNNYDVKLKRAYEAQL